MQKKERTRTPLLADCYVGTANDSSKLKEYLSDRLSQVARPPPRVGYQGRAQPARATSTGSRRTEVSAREVSGLKRPHR